MSDWVYNRDRYITMREAVTQTNRQSLLHPVIALALTQIEVASIAIDAIMKQREEDGEFEE
jgi:hypothetical protein